MVRGTGSRTVDHLDIGDQFALPIVDDGVVAFTEVTEFREGEIGLNKTVNRVEGHSNGVDHRYDDYHRTLFFWSSFF